MRFAYNNAKNLEMIRDRYYNYSVIYDDWRYYNGKNKNYPAFQFSGKLW